MLKHWKLSLFSLFMLLLLVWAYRPAPLELDIARAEKKDFRISIREEGYTEYMDPYRIHAPVPGNMERIQLKAGDMVQKAQVIVRIHPVLPVPADARQEEANRERLKQAEKSVELAAYALEASDKVQQQRKHDLERMSNLHKAKQASDQQLEQSRLSYELAVLEQQKARVALQQARHQESEARAMLKAYPDDTAASAISLSSPMAGVVSKVFRESAGVVQAGALLMELAEPGRIQGVVEMLTADAVQLKAGMKVLLEQWGGSELEATVYRVEPAAFTKVSALGVEEQRVRVLLHIDRDAIEKRGLGHGYRFEALFVLEEKGDVLQVPTSAVFRHEEGWAVVLLRDGHSHVRAVEISAGNGMDTVIASGLVEGDLLIRFPDERVMADGVRVESVN